jgi:hypothetical protein
LAKRKIKTGSNKLTFKNIILIALAAVLLGELLVTAQTIFSTQEGMRPANLNLVRIVDANCVSCTTVGSLSNAIENNTNAKISDIKTLEFSSLDAKALIMKYNITKIPAVVVTGEFKKDNIVSLWGQLNGRMLTDAVVLEAQPPYVDAQTTNEVGLVSVTYVVDSSCTICGNLTGVVNLFQQQGMAVSGTQTIEYSSSEGQKAIQDYSIQRIPAVVFSNDIAAYPAIQQLLLSLNSTERNGSYAFHTTTPPYLDIAQNQIVGKVNVILLNDSSCITCYDVTQHLQILQRFGVYVSNSTIIDVNSTEGQSLIAKYNITKVPTLLISPDAKYYNTLNAAWQPVGTVASDGWYIFNSTEVMGIYKNLATGQIVNPAQK